MAKERTHVVLGDRVRCRITGCEGIAVARTDWIYGCLRWGVQREKLEKEGKVQDPAWFDDDQLVIVERNTHLSPGLLEASEPAPPVKPKKPRTTGRPRTGGPDRGEALDDPAETG